MKLPVRAVRRAARRLLPQGYVDDVVRPRRLADEIRRSGLFDAEWYATHLDTPMPDGVDPIEHYVKTSLGTGISPNPCFVSDWYVSRPNAPKSLDVEPFLHYLRRGAARGISPHPMFDAAQYLIDHPGAASHPGGPLGHYLSKGWRTGAAPSAQFDPAAYERVYGEVDGPPLADFARRVDTILRETRGYEHLPRTSPTFDHDAAERFATSVTSAYAKIDETAPLVSIVIPTKDRADGVVAAIRSVQAQTYQHWQLIVVDDGSSDGTVEALQPFLADPRVELVRREHAGGVSVARNAGLAIATGDYVAYLDSDNTWTSRFLEVMVAFVRTRQVRFGYAVSELVEEKKGGRRGYRALPFHRDALLERNFIDCIVVLHERSLLAEVGAFDEGLRRNVDWDLFIRMAKVTDFEQAPFIATTYDAWEQRTDRITINEPFGYRFVIVAKHAVDWQQTESGMGERAPGSVSVVIHAAETAPHLPDTIQQLFAEGDDSLEVVVVDAKLRDGEASHLQFLQMLHPRLRVLRDARSLSPEVGRSLGACASTGETIVFATSDTRVEPGWLEPLVAPLRERTAAASQPLVLQSDGTVWSAGVAFARGALGHGLFRQFAGDAPEVVQPAERQALASRVLAVRADDFVRVRGFEPIFVNDADSPDLSLRLARGTGRELRYVPQSLVSLTGELVRPEGRSAEGTANDNQEIFVDRWRDVVDSDADDVWNHHGLAIVGYDGRATTHAGFDPIVVRDRPAAPLRWAIKIGAPNVSRRTNWGDWHFAVALKDALQRLGHEAVVDCKQAWYRPTSRLDDVALVLRGVTTYLVNPQQTNLMWVISHPERVAAREAGSFDAVFAASGLLAHKFAADLGRPVGTLLQCTDQFRFRPVPPDARRRHEVLFVGNARGVRESVRTALQAGIVPAVYGLRWKGLVPDGAWCGDYIPNEELASTYVAAGAVLNDHWDDMRREGLLSNRLFDLAACGARIVTDDVPGLRDVFGDAVLTYCSPDELARAVGTHLNETPERAEQRLALSERIRREHSFDARAEALVEAVHKLQAGRDTARVKYEA